MVTCRWVDDQPSGEAIYRIDLEKRLIQVPPGEIGGVYHETGVETKKFVVSRYYHGIDLNDFRVEIHAQNAEGKGQIYQAENVVVGEEEITFEWTITNLMTAKAGAIMFLVTFVRSEDEVIVQKLSTCISWLCVAKGFWFEGEAIEQDPDIVGEILSISNSRFYIEDGDLIWEKGEPR